MELEKGATVHRRKAQRRGCAERTYAPEESKRPKCTSRQNAELARLATVKLSALTPGP